MRMSSRIDAVAARVQTAITMKQVGTFLRLTQALIFIKPDTPTFVKLLYEKCVYVCMYICLSFCTHVSKLLKYAV